MNDQDGKHELASGAIFIDNLALGTYLFEGMTTVRDVTYIQLNGANGPLVALHRSNSKTVHKILLDAAQHVRGEGFEDTTVTVKQGSDTEVIIVEANLSQEALTCWHEYNQRAETHLASEKIE